MKFSPTPPPSGRQAPGRLLLLMLIAILALLVGKEPVLNGDVEEYGLLTIALASHASPEIRQTDIDRGRQLLPGFGAQLDALSQDLRTPSAVPQPGFYRGRDGSVQAIHFFAYPALAALPFKLLQAAGLPPFKCYQVVNLGAVLVLALSLLRLYGSTPRALAGVALFMLCGGWLYWCWPSPEVLSAAALLAGLVWFCCDAPLLGGLLIGVAALQNPSIVLALGGAPLLAAALRHRADAGWPAQLKTALRPRVLLGVALGLALFALGPLYNLFQFGVPSIIAQIATSRELVSLVRLHSLYFDLNQGMLVAIPALPLALLWLALRAGRARWRAHGAVAALALLLTLAFALPALSVNNWNSGAAGVMRYAFWCAMPLLFLLLWRLRELPRWPVAPLLALALAQGLAMASAASYTNVQFSPLARWLLRTAPALYNPEPEIFAERTAGQEGNLDPARIYSYKVGLTAVKSMIHRDYPHPELLCGDGGQLAGAALATTGGWAYVNGPLSCGDAVRIEPRAFARGHVLLLGGGWSVVEQAGGVASGVWSDGEVSTLVIAYPPNQGVNRLALLGNYWQGNTRTRVRINGVDLGWHALAAGALLTVPGQDAHIHSLTVELRHEAPRSPGPEDGRKLAFYLREARLQ